MDMSTGRLLISPPDSEGNVLIPEHLQASARVVAARGIPLWSEEHEFAALRTWAINASLNHPGKERPSRAELYERPTSAEISTTEQRTKQAWADEHIIKKSGRQPETPAQIRAKRQLQKQRKQAKKRNRQ